MKKILLKILQSSLVVIALFLSSSIPVQAFKNLEIDNVFSLDATTTTFSGDIVANSFTATTPAGTDAYKMLADAYIVLQSAHNKGYIWSNNSVGTQISYDGPLDTTKIVVGSSAVTLQAEGSSVDLVGVKFGPAASDNFLNLGSSGLRWKDGWFGGTVTSTNLMVSGVVTATRMTANGTSLVPQLNFSVDQNTGVGVSSAGILDLHVGGTPRVRLSATDFVAIVDVVPNSVNTYSLGRSTLPWKNVYAGFVSSTSALIGNPSLSPGILGVGAATSSLYTMVVQSPNTGQGAIQILSGTGYEIVASNTLDIQSGGTTKLGASSAQSTSFYSNGAESNAQFRLESSGNQITMRPGSASAISAEFNSTSTVFNVTTTIASAYFTAANLNALAATGDFVCQNNTTGNLEVQLANCTVSSAYFKQHIESLSSSEMLKLVNKLRPVLYEMKLDGRHEKGFIAEEVALIDPTLVVFEESTDPDRISFAKKKYPKSIVYKGEKTFLPKTVDYMRMTVVLTGAIQNIDERLTQLESKQ